MSFTGQHQMLLLVIVSLGTVLDCHAQHFVDPRVPLVEFEGWGTSLTWWPDVLGAMPEDVIDKVTRAFFAEDGLNLNIVRYTIGGTTPGNYTCGSYRAGAATESFKDGPDMPYNWSRDPRQRRILSIAKDLGVDTFEAFSNSPPQWMTISGCSKGNTGGGVLHSNFDASQAPAFANYVADVLEHFKDSWGIPFKTYAPFNEPYGLQGFGGWLGSLSSQEGCNMNRQTMADTIREFYATFQARNLSVELSVSDETQVDTAVGCQEFFRQQNVTQFVGKVNVHGYWDSESAKRDVLFSGSVKDGHRLWMDEMGWGSTSLENMGQGLEIATRIVKDFREMCPSAWVYWQVLEDVGGWGLLSVPYNNASVATVTYNSGYFAFLQFTKYIRKGFAVVHVSAENTIAAYNEASETLVLVLVNADNATKSNVSYSLRLFDSVGKISGTRTSATEQNKDVSTEVEYLSSLERLIVTLTPESITTIVVENASVVPSKSVIQDGGFEDNSSQWKLTGGADFSASRSWLGDQSGMVRNGSISQEFNMTSGGELFLSARCAAVGNANLSIAVNSYVRSVTVDRNMFILYSLSHVANEGDLVSVTFESAGEAFIDNVEAHVR